MKPFTTSIKTIHLFTFILFTCISLQSNAQDWRDYYKHTNFEKYKADNQKVGLPEMGTPRVVFMGNSITEAWPILSPDFFENSAYVGRGISGQTTPQMLLRFRKDVIALQPKVVVILAGINDIAGNTGVTPIELIAENILSMTELARYNGIEVILCSVLPALDFPWSSGLEPADKVIKLNGILQDYARENDLIYVDYHTGMKDENDGLKVPEYTTADDLVHPNAKGYKVMEKLVTPAIEQALRANSLEVCPLYSDHVVLQQKEKVAIWGAAFPNANVTVKGTWGEEAKTIADADGKWGLKLSTPSAGGPYNLTVSTEEQSVEIRDVMIGEVWLASGQSNMQMSLKGWPPRDPIQDSEQEIANAEYLNIRMFRVGWNYSLEVENTFSGKWDVCSPETATDFSATAYFFARRLYQELNIPIGIIHTSWGGTPAEAWTSKEKIKSLGDFDEILANIEDPKMLQKTDDWYARWEKWDFPEKAEGWNTIDLNDLHIAKPDYEGRNWSKIKLPGQLDLYEGKDLDGAFWLRKTVELTDVSMNHTFVMGPVDDTDAVFFNGEKIGGTVNNYSDTRNYPIPKSLLKKGTNTIAIRVIDTGGPGSISGKFELTNGKETVVSLAGEWDRMVTAEFFKGEIYLYDLEKIDLSERPNIVYPSPYATPSVLYNAMINPLIPFNFKGAIWYQGESNVGRAEQYKRLFPAMIEDWRTRWESDFPFYFVQIAPYEYNKEEDKSLDKSQKLRDAQRYTLSLSKTGMVVTLDIGNPSNIHPANKQDVGARLAGFALGNDYGKDIVVSGPLYKSHSIKGNKLLLEFDYVGGGLLAKDDLLSDFEVAGADKEFVTAVAKIVGDQVSLSADGIEKPMYARYAWRDTSTGSLTNVEGLPASSFTTED